MILMNGYVGGPPIVMDWAANSLVFAGNYRVHSLIVANKNASTVYVQIYDQVGTDVTQSANGSGIPRYEIPVPAGDILSLTHSQFNKGLFVQAVTVQGSNGTANKLATADLKITAEGLPWPVSVGV